MLKKTITSTDFNGVERTEDFYFNLTKAEILEMELTATGNSFAEHMKNVIASENGQMIMDVFKSILFKAYGEKSEDGKRFVKSDELALNFSHTSAFDVLFVELITDAQASAAFINGIVPAELTQKAASNAEDARAASIAQMQGFQKKVEKPKETIEVVPDLPAGEPVLEAYNEHVANPVDVSSMTREELIAHFGQATDVKKQ